ncbi:MAG: hypothetical protein Kow0054_32600 [Deferrisoma sp.]
MRPGEIAANFGLSSDRAEALLVTYRAQDLSTVVRPGERVAFVPYGPSGPHRCTVGIYTAGKTGPI